MTDPDVDEDRPARRARRLHNLEVDEVSGVDYPAHLDDGWLVLKGVSDVVDGFVDEIMHELDTISQQQPGRRPQPQPAATQPPQSPKESPVSKPAATSRPRPPSEEDVQGYIDNYARQVIAKSATPLTREQAIARVVDERPHLYEWHKEALQRRQASAVRPAMDLAEVNDRVVVKSAAGWSIEQEATRRYPELSTAGAVDAFMQTPEGHAAYRRYRELEQ